MAYWIRQLGLVVLGVFLSGLPLEMPLTDPGASPTRSAPETDRRGANSSLRLCVRASVDPLEMDLRVRTQEENGNVKPNDDDRSLTLCVGAASGPPGTDRSTLDD